MRSFKYRICKKVTEPRQFIDLGIQGVRTIYFDFGEAIKAKAEIEAMHNVPVDVYEEEIANDGEFIDLRIVG